jgi:hypothetical protein
MKLMHSASALAIIAATASSSALAQTQTIATPLNVDAINLLMGFSTLPIAGMVLTNNFNTAISTNNSSNAAQRQQAIIDNTITTDNGVVLSDALGSKMSQIWNAVNSQAASGATITFSNNVLQLFRQINAISQDDSGKAKNFFADGSANGSVFISNGNLAAGKTATSNAPINKITLPGNGHFNIYDLSYNPPAATRNLTGNSRPIQVNPNGVATFTFPNYFGVAQSNPTPPSPAASAATWDRDCLPMLPPPAATPPLATPRHCCSRCWFQSAIRNSSPVRRNTATAVSCSACIIRST